MNKLLFCFFILIGFTSCAQVKNSFRRTYFFAQPASYGQQLRDIEGTPVARKIDTLYFIYLETDKKAEMKVTSVQYNGKWYQAAVYPVTEQTVHVGTTESGEQVIIKNDLKKNLVKVELSEDENSKTVPPKSGIEIKGLLNAKPFKLQLKKKTMLAAEIRG